MEYILKNSLKIEIRVIEVSDAQSLVKYVKTVSYESNNLLHEPGEWRLTVPQERKWIEETIASPKNLSLVAVLDDEIIAVGSIYGSTLRRIKHRSSLSISVLKEFNGIGIGKILLKKLIKHAETIKLKKVDVELRYDLKNAIHLLETAGFKKEGIIECGFFVDEKYIDLVLYGKVLEED
ncbi:MAG: GNAT family protein [Candidatus Izemoplasma sp.]